MNKRVLIDIILWVIATLLCMLWRWVADKSGMTAYWALFGSLTVAWILIGWIVQLYRSYKLMWFWQSMLSLVATAGILIGLSWWILPQLPWGLSPKVATWMLLLVGALDTGVILIEHYWKYATNMTVPAMQIEHRDNAVVTRQDAPRSPHSMYSIRQSVLSVTTDEDYRMLLDRSAVG